MSQSPGDIAPSTKVKKIKWDDTLTTTFIAACYDVVRDGHRPSAAFKAIGWSKVMDHFTKHTNKNFTKKQLKTKWDGLKKEWQLWIKLKKDTGIGWAPNGTVFMENDWLAAKIEENQIYRRFRHGPLEHKEDLDYIFLGTSATGDYAFVPGASATVNTTQSSMYVEESSGDSEDVDLASPPNNTKRATDTRTNLVPPSSAPQKRKTNVDARMEMSKSMDNIASAFSHPVVYASSSQAAESCCTVGDVLDTLHAHMDSDYGDHFYEWCSMYFFDKANRLHFRDLRRPENQVMWVKKVYNDHCIFSFVAPSGGNSAAARQQSPP